MNNKEENICKNCKHFRSLISSDVVFTERVEICQELNIEWPCETSCKYFESIEKIYIYPELEKRKINLNIKINE